MNGTQHEIVLREGAHRCAVCWLSYDAGTYPQVCESLHPFSRLTVDHWAGRRRVKGYKVDEEWDDLWVVCGECHWQLDNGGRDQQITYVRRRIVELSRVVGGLERIVRLTVVLHLLESGMNLKGVGRLHIDARGPAPADYEIAKEQEYRVDDPARRRRRGKSLHRDYKTAKGRKQEKLRWYLKKSINRRPPTFAEQLFSRRAKGSKGQSPSTPDEWPSLPSPP